MDFVLPGRARRDAECNLCLYLKRSDVSNGPFGNAHDIGWLASNH